MCELAQHSKAHIWSLIHSIAFVQKYMCALGIHGCESESESEGGRVSEKKMRKRNTIALI